MSSAGSLPPARYEPTEGSPAMVVLTAGGLAACLVLVLVVAAWITQHHSEVHRATNTADLSFTHGPQAQTGIARDWIEQDAAVREHLQTYGWTDRAAGVARIPIDRAMDVLSQETEGAPRKEPR